MFLNVTKTIDCILYLICCTNLIVCSLKVNFFIREYSKCKIQVILKVLKDLHITIMLLRANTPTIILLA